MEQERVGWCFSLGRHHLTVDGIVVATEGDLCRDTDMCAQMKSRVWTGEGIKRLACFPTSSPPAEKGGAHDA